ncbi:hypothetical protein PT2222_330094 [Paraburkholderia tropica]
MRIFADNMLEQSVNHASVRPFDMIKVTNGSEACIQAFVFKRISKIRRNLPVFR